jgi:hypothetical protein
VNIKGRLRLGVTTSNQEDDYASLEITDDDAGVQFLSGKCSLEAIAQALLGRREIEIDLTLRGLEKLGTIREHKREVVPYDCYQSPRTEEHIAEVLAPFEVDGWQARRGDLWNGHCRVGLEKAQRVGFERWVTREPAP